MGGCASKPKDSQVESLDESPINPKEIPISIDGNSPVESDDEKQNVENEQKEEPLPVDHSDPKPDTANPAEDSTAKVQSNVTDLVSDIGWSNSGAPQDLEKDSDDPQEVAEIIHVKEKTGVVDETGDQPKKSMEQTQDSETTETATKRKEIEPDMQKPDGKGEGQSPNSEALKDTPTS